MRNTVFLLFAVLAACPGTPPPGPPAPARALRTSSETYRVETPVTQFAQTVSFNADGRVVAVCLVAILPTGSKIYMPFVDDRLPHSPEAAAAGLPCPAGEYPELVQERRPFGRGTAGRYLVVAPWEPHGVVGDTIRMGAHMVVEGQSRSCKPRWESLNPEVATISEDGEIVVRREGSSTIRATCADLTVGTTGSFGKNVGGGKP